MAIPTLGTLGEELNLLIKQGSTFGPMTVVATNQSNGAVIDLTSCTIRAQMRRKALDVGVIATFDVQIIDAAGGEFTFELSDEITAAIEVDEILQKPLSQFTWDMELEDSIGNVIPLFYGKAEVYREVTRP